MAPIQASNTTSTDQQTAQTFSFGGQTITLAPRTVVNGTVINWWYVGGAAAVLLALVAVLLKKKG